MAESQGVRDTSFETRRTRNLTHPAHRELFPYSDFRILQSAFN
jgi:hypothetical protein